MVPIGRFSDDDIDLIRRQPDGFSVTIVFVSTDRISGLTA